MRDLNCAHCDATFQVSSEYRGRPRMYCSDYCRGAAHYAKNRLKAIEASRRYREAHPEYRDQARAATLLRKYGLTLEAFDALLLRQGGCCAICYAKEPGGRGTWQVDHDHNCCPGVETCGECVRGLLCCACNRALGYFKDSPRIIASAGDYLARAAVTRGAR